MRAAADEVARLIEPSPRIELNGHSASSLLRALAEAGAVDPPVFEGVRGKGRDGSLVHISPFEPADALFAFAWKEKDGATTFVHGYFYFAGPELLEWVGLRRGRDSISFQRLTTFISHVQGVNPDPSLPPFADAILARLRASRIV